MKHMTKRILSLLLVFAMLCGLLCTTTFAADETWSGSGTAEDPFLIEDAADLTTLSTSVNSGTKYSGTYFKLTADIEVTNWDPIGYNSSYYFLGDFDGDGHTVTINGVDLTAHSTATARYFGLFGYGYYTGSGANVVRPRIHDVAVDGSYDVSSLSSGYVYAGGIIGYSTGSVIVNCVSTMDITASTATYKYAGGIAGYGTSMYTAMYNCYASGTITAYKSGGIVGYINSGTYEYCFTTAEAVSSSTYGTRTGCYTAAEWAALSDAEKSAWVTAANGNTAISAYTSVTDFWSLGSGGPEHVTCEHLNSVQTGVVAVTCTEDGYTLYHCYDCGKDYKADIVSAPGHVWDDGVVTKEATCTEDGVRLFTCTCDLACCVDEAETKTESIPALGHEYENGVCIRCGAKEPTIQNVTIGTGTSSNYYAPYGNYCKNALVEMIYTAEQIGVAGDITELAFQVAVAASHATTDVKIYMGHTDKSAFSGTTDWMAADDLTLVYEGSPTLGTATGWESITLDTAFDYNGTDNLVIAVSRTASNYLTSLKYYYTTTGYATLYRGSDSYATYADYSNVTQTGTRYAYQPNIQLTLDVCPHADREALSVVPPTCTEDGYTNYHCNDCGKDFTDDIVPALGHDFSVYVETVAPTCTEQGYDVYRCARDGSTTTQTNLVPALGHVWGDDDICIVCHASREWDGTTTTQPTVDENGVYLIDEGAKLAWFRDYVNAGNDTASAKLTYDISMGANDWTPIGGSSDETDFEGTFDGDGHSVRLNVQSSSNTKSLFNNIGPAGTVKNVVITGSISGANGIAGIAYYNYGTIDSCVNKADITASGTTAYYAAGICAFLYGGTVINCGNEGTVTVNRTGTTSGSAAAGGIAGVVNYEADGANGGTAHIYNCYNWGDVSCSNAAASSYAESGGIAGQAYASTSGGVALDVQNSYNAGAVTTGTSNAKIGAVLGYVPASSTSCKPNTLTNCYWSDSSLAGYNVSSASYAKYAVTATNCVTYTDNADLLTALNSNIPTGGSTWVADTGYDGQPAFRVSVVPQYTVTFTGDYTGVVTVGEGGKITPPECDEGHYYTYAVNGVSFTPETTRIYEDLTITVTRHIYTYTVTYSAGTGSGSVPASMTYDWNTTVNVDFSTLPSKDGYTFFGWVDGDDETVVYTADGTASFVLTGDKTLTAKYQGYAFKGSGTETDPYQVEDVASLKAVAGLVNQNDPDYLSAYYIQTADIDMTGVDWTPIGYVGTALQNGSVYFAGSYDGQGHTIENLTYNGSLKAAALFAGLNSATVKNLNVTGSFTTSSSYAAGIACYVYGTSVIENCQVNADVTATMYVGGIAAYILGTAKVINCGHQGTVTGTGSYAGGVVCYVAGSAQLRNSYHGAGAVSSKGSYVGGVAGYAPSANVVIDNCYSAASSVTTTSTSTSAIPGGVIGYLSTYKPTVTNCWYNSDGANSGVGYVSSSSTFVNTTKAITTPAALASALNAVAEQTEGYESWKVEEGANDGYPVFGTADSSVMIVSYDANGAGGTAPADTKEYTDDDNTATILGAGELSWPYHRFLGWSTSKNAVEAEYTEGQTVPLTENLILYAVWEEYTNWTQTGDASYEINDAAGMAELAYKVNSQNQYPSKTGISFTGYTFTLTEDVDLTAEDLGFAAIGYFNAFNAENYFDGTFDGGGHTVTIALSGGCVQGLFGYVGANGVIRNVTVAGTVADTVASTTSDIGTANSRSGGLVGWNKGSVINCTSSVSVSSTAGQIGGLVGYNAGVVDGCVYTGGAVSGYGYVGGLTGGNGGTVRNSAVKSGTVSSAGTSVSISAYAGGVAGYNAGTLYNNYSWADISSASYAGGVVGNNSSSGTVRNNYSAGTIAGTTVGGVLGYTTYIAQNNYWLTGTADTAAGYDSNQYAIRNSSFTSDGTLAQSVQVWSNASESAFESSLYDALTRWVSYWGEDYAAWVRTESYPAFDAEPPVSEKFDIAFANMTIGNALDMNFAFAKSNAEDWTGYYAVITKTYADGRADTVQSIALDSWSSATISGVAHYYVTFTGIAAKEMSDEITVVIYNAEGEAVSNVWTDSVKEYAMRTLENTSSTAKTLTMVVDLLNYGAAAQTYFGYNTDNLANADLTETQKGYATDSTSYTDTRVRGANYLGSSLLLENNIKLLMAFQNVSTDMTATITYIDHYNKPQTVNAKVVDGAEYGMSGAYVVVIESLVVADARQDVTCTITNNGTEVASATDSIESYVAREMSSGSVNPLFEAIMKLADSAYAFFH